MAKQAPGSLKNLPTIMTCTQIPRKGMFLVDRVLKAAYKLKACSHGGAVEDLSFLPSVRSFTREPVESILATPSEFSIKHILMHRTGLNRKENSYCTLARWKSGQKVAHLTEELWLTFEEFT